MAPARSLTVHACAKINLGLEIIKKRKDGFHELVTVFQTIDLADDITIELGGFDLQVRTIGRFSVPDGPDHLCIRAARAFFEAANMKPAAAIRVIKRIPVGAGLGGGSADAAATLCALQRLTGANVDIMAIAAEVGSDCAFFIHGGTALGTGRGEILIQADHSLPNNIVIVNPGVSVNTKSAYGLISPHDWSNGQTTQELFNRIASGDDILPCAGLMTNTFQPIIEAEYPAIRTARESLIASGATIALMSGSGSSVFGIFADLTAAQTAAQHISENGSWTYCGNMIDYTPCERSLSDGDGHRNA